jgi:hypothetical protein
MGFLRSSGIGKVCLIALVANRNLRGLHRPALRRGRGCLTPTLPVWTSVSGGDVSRDQDTLMTRLIGATARSAGAPGRGWGNAVVQQRAARRWPRFPSISNFPEGPCRFNGNTASWQNRHHPTVTNELRLSRGMGELRPEQGLLIACSFPTSNESKQAFLFHDR